VLRLVVVRLVVLARVLVLPALVLRVLPFPAVMLRLAVLRPGVLRAPLAGQAVVGCPRRAAPGPEPAVAQAHRLGPTTSRVVRAGPRRPSGTAASAGPRPPSGTGGSATAPTPGAPEAHPRANPGRSRPGSLRAVRSGCSTRPRPSTAERTWRPARDRPGTTTSPASAATIPALAVLAASSSAATATPGCARTPSGSVP
jgi:hypothetical protein